MARKQLGRLQQIFMNSMASGAGIIAGFTPQVLLGLLIFVFGLYIQKINNTLGMAFIVIGLIIGLQYGKAFDMIAKELNK